MSIQATPNLHMTSHIANCSHGAGMIVTIWGSHKLLQSPSRVAVPKDGDHEKHRAEEQQNNIQHRRKTRIVKQCGKQRLQTSTDAAISHSFDPPPSMLSSHLGCNINTATGESL
mmetsp:Transcript_3245/g.6383  ORF Transcript_3245/g.6383 Transcript_3245/m.6383 type:complete len:114 (-) Transcript_3245:193-534(-)